MPKSAKRARMTFTGLCSTCANDPSCTFPRKAGVPVMHCLEFLGETLVADLPVPKSPATEPRAGASPTRGVDASHRIPGLCFWCENNASCTFPRSAGGVWSCDEYR
jgi:hypothetical protein